MTHKEPTAPPRSTPAGEPALQAEALTDETLLKRYSAHRDEDAFAVLVQRFGPLVFGVCQRVLGHRQDAEDAFQATFLVLARKAGTIANAQATAAFLCRVASRLAKRVKRQKARRFMAPLDPGDVPAREETPAVIWQELQPVLDEEVDRLPEKYRLPFVLCYLRGLTYEQAARRLRCPVGTLSSWLIQARERLRRRLLRRGIALSSGLLATVLAAYAGPVPPPLSLASAVSRHAILFAAGSAPVAPAVPVELASGYVRSWSRADHARKATCVLILGIGLALLIFGLRQWWPTASAPRKEPVAPALRPRGHPDQFQGVWEIIELTIAGNPVPPRNTRMIFEGNSCKLASAGGVVVSMTFTLDPTTNPKHIDLTIFTPRRTPALGIYELSGDELRICYSTREAPRPTEFASHPNTNELLYRLRRSPP